MSNTLISVRVCKRPVLFGGVTHAPGSEIAVPASIAGDLIRSGRARLVDVADLGPVIDAEEARRRGVLRDERPRWPRMVLHR